MYDTPIDLRVFLESLVFFFDIIRYLLSALCLPEEPTLEKSGVEREKKQENYNAKKDSAMILNVTVNLCA